MGSCSSNVINIDVYNIDRIERLSYRRPYDISQPAENFTETIPLSDILKITEVRKLTWNMSDLIVQAMWLSNGSVKYTILNNPDENYNLTTKHCINSGPKNLPILIIHDFRINQRHYYSNSNFTQIKTKI